jgi:flagellar P-ring protein precursor FlgI
MNSKTIIRLSAAIVLASWIWATPAASQTKLRSFCRVKGQEQNTLTALGLVTGLKGTGDGGNFMPTIRSLGMAMQYLGSQVGSGGINELKDVKNVAIVTVTASVPAAGAREGDRIDCVVTSIGSAKSLAGGRLFLTSMMGPIPDPKGAVYAVAEGPVTIEDAEIPTVGRIHAGCQMVEDFFNPYVEDGKITLVLKESFADWVVIQEMVGLINDSELIDSGGSSSGLIRPGSIRSGRGRSEPVFQGNSVRPSRVSTVPAARAIDQLNIEIEVPSQYLSDPVLFLSEIMDLDVLEPRTGAKIVINEKSGVIVCSADVEIGAVAVTHKNIVTVEAGENLIGGGFVPVATDDPQHPKLKALIDALKAVKVPNDDIIDIIKGIEANGRLYGQLIIR